jgi:hypothetical protein
MGKQNRELLENIERYEQKEKIKQQESKVLGQKPLKREANKGKEINVYNSQQRESIRCVV